LNPQNKRDLTGQRFGRLIALKDSGERCCRNIIWICKCSCGNVTKVKGTQLTVGKTKSCGCLLKEVAAIKGRKRFKHGEGGDSRLYRIWATMKKRCYNSKFHAYHRYGGRGINVCIEWKNDFIKFRDWALINGYQNNLTIDRIDNDGNYEPNNCQWLTRSRKF